MNPVLISIWRTVQPTAIGSAASLLVSLGLVPAGTSDAHTLLVAAIGAAGSWLVYAGARWVESQSWCPKALAVLLMGAVTKPVYPTDAPAAQAGEK
jgi:hypothetical protein